MSLEAVLDAGIVVCTGSGGVGKTTLAAAIGLEGARRGKTTVVLTIDPAKRLADSLGLRELSNEPRRVPAAQFRKARMAAAPLDAMMLDTKTTFDQLVHRYARSPERAERIINNRFYQAISGALSGTHEYMAMEKLYELHQEDTYDLIVIDTPPTRHALDFLEAPKRITSFLDGRLLKWFLLPTIGGGRGVFRAMNVAAVAFLRVVQRVVGAQVLKDTTEFFENFEGMYEGFKERAQAVYDLLRSESTRFVVITAPAEQAVEEALFFASTMHSYGLPFGGLVINRLHPSFTISRAGRSGPGSAGAQMTGTPLVDCLLRVAEDFEQVRRREHASLERLEAEIPRRRWVQIPYLTREVIDLKDLAEMGRLMFG
ncbi:MAG: ArsA family ATPase [Actinomycetota bacterium]